MKKAAMAFSGPSNSGKTTLILKVAKKFIDDNKENLGDYLEQAKALVAGNDLVSGAVDKIKGLF